MLTDDADHIEFYAVESQGMSAPADEAASPLLPAEAESGGVTPEINPHNGSIESPATSLPVNSDESELIAETTQYAGDETDSSASTPETTPSETAVEGDNGLIPYHPLANAFPLIEGEEYIAFCEDISNNGQQEPIVLLDGMILDGRNRYRALCELGIDPVTTEYEGNTPLEFVLSMNMYRRQLTVAQRSMIAAEIVYRPGTVDTSQEDGDTPNQSLRPGLNLAQAATLLGISERSISSASRVARTGADELLDAVKSGKVKISVAEYIAKLDADEQRAVCAQGAKAMREMARELREDRRLAAADKKQDAASQIDALDEQTETISNELHGPETALSAISSLSENSHSGDNLPVVNTTAALFYFASSVRREGVSAKHVAESICQELSNNDNAEFEADAIIFASEVIAAVRARMVQIAINDTLA